jgi:hypothetical protein
VGSTREATYYVYCNKIDKQSRPFIDDSADVLDELFHPTYDCLARLDVCLR